MRCPFCGADDTQVKDSRPTDDRGAIRRRRFCPNCAGGSRRMATEPWADAATSTSDRPFDLRMMRAALALARRGLGTVWPNPAVGCVIADRGRVVGRGWTQSGGRPHGETEAVGRAGEAARGATAYLSLEPCCPWGRTPPCTDAPI